MPKYTSNLNLKKPEQDEFYNVDDFNGNCDIIDTFSKSATEHITDKNNPHNTTADKAKASKMLTSEEVMRFSTLLEACNALKHGGGFVVPYESPISKSSDYPERDTEMAFFISCESDGQRKSLLGVRHHGGDMNIYQRNIYQASWETEWNSTENTYLSLSGGTVTGGIAVNDGIGSLGAIEQYFSLAHKEAKGSNNYRNLSISNTFDVEDSLMLHEVRNGVEVATYRIFGEHNKHLMGISFISETRNYSGSGLNTFDGTTGKWTSEVELLPFDFPVKILFMGRRKFIPKGTGTNSDVATTADAYQFDCSTPINIEEMTNNIHNGNAIAVKAKLNGVGYATLVISADRKNIKITSDLADPGMNEDREYYFYTAIG